MKSAYKDYFDSRLGDLFYSKLTLAIAVWEVDTTNYSIHSSVYYDKQIIKDDLNKLSAAELLSKLAGLPNN